MLLLYYQQQGTFAAIMIVALAVLSNEDLLAAFQNHKERKLKNDHNNPTRYNDILVAPSDEDLRTMWIVYATLLFVFTIFMSIVFIAIVTNKKLRSNSFNLYLIFLMVPDLICTGFCDINCAWLAINGGFCFQGMCSFQFFYLMFGVGANAWLNGIIAY